MVFDDFLLLFTSLDERIVCFEVYFTEDISDFNFMVNNFLNLSINSVLMIKSIKMFIEF